MISKKLLIFVLLFMVFEYIFLAIEWKPYLDMYTDLEGYKYNWFKTENKLDLLRTINFSWGYFIFMWVIGIILGDKLYTPNKSSILLIIWLWVTWSFAYFIMLKRGLKHLPILLVDILFTGVACLLLTQFVFNKFYKILEKNIPILILCYFLTMFLFFYVSYRYNPDLSNINVIRSIPHLLILLLSFSIATYIFYKLK